MPSATPEMAETTAAERPRPFPLPVELYERLVGSGVFGDRSPIFLWNGQLVEPMTKGPFHGFALMTLQGLLFQTLPRGWHVRQESPLRLGGHSEPEPDLTVARGTPRDYLRRHPGPADVALVVEVADASLRFDTGEKLHAYASAGVPTYWVVNILEERVEVYSEPSASGYRTRVDHARDARVPLVLEGREIGTLRVQEILP